MFASTADCSRFCKLEEKSTSSFITKINGQTGGTGGCPSIPSTIFHSHSRGDLVLEGVGRDPVGSFQKNGFSIDAEIKAQSWRPDNWVLDEFYCAKIHLQERFVLFRSQFF